MAKKDAEVKISFDDFDASKIDLEKINPSYISTIFSGWVIFGHEKLIQSLPEKEYADFMYDLQRKFTAMTEFWASFITCCMEGGTFSEKDLLFLRSHWEQIKPKDDIEGQNYLWN